MTWLIETDLAAAFPSVPLLAIAGMLAPHGEDSQQRTKDSTMREAPRAPPRVKRPTDMQSVGHRPSDESLKVNLDMV